MHVIITVMLVPVGLSPCTHVISVGHLLHTSEHVCPAHIHTRAHTRTHAHTRAHAQTHTHVAHVHNNRLDSKVSKWSLHGVFGDQTGWPNELSVCLTPILGDLEIRALLVRNLPGQVKSTELQILCLSLPSVALSIIRIEQRLVNLVSGQCD